MAVRMIQLTSREEWLKKRTSYVGGSEAAALVGKNPYMTNIDLYRIKTGQQADILYQRAGTETVY